MPQTKRQVSYNQDAVLCPCCKKRIRVNNDSRLRVHVSGKAGSARCMGSGEFKPLSQATFADVDNSPVQEKTVSQGISQKDPLWQDVLFSDLSS